MQSLFNNKKGVQLGQVPQVILTFVLIAILLGVSMTILAKVKDTQTTDSKAYNVTGLGEDAVEDIGDWQTTWAVILAAAVVLGLVGGFLYFGKR